MSLSQTTEWERELNIEDDTVESVLSLSYVQGFMRTQQ